MVLFNVLFFALFWLQTSSIHRWSEWSSWSDCFVASCTPRKQPITSKFLHENKDDSPFPDSEIYCVRRDYTHSRLNTFENSYGITKLSTTNRYRYRNCTRVQPFDFFNVITHDSCKKGFQEIECQPCFANQVPFSLESNKSLPLCPQSSWLFKLVGGIFAVFIAVGLLLILFRLLQSLDCFNVYQSTNEPIPRRNSSLPNESESPGTRINDALLFGHPMKDKLPDYNQVLENPDRYVLSSNPPDPISQDSEIIIGFRGDSNENATVDQPPSYQEVTSYIDASQDTTPRFQQ